MPVTRTSDFRPGDRIVLVGTTKGAFLYRGRGKAYQRVGEPRFAGQPVYAMAYDDRGGRVRLFAGTEHPHFGSVLCASDDLGRSFSEPQEPNVKFPPDTGLSLKQIWQIAPGRVDEPEIMYLGVSPSSLFESKDGGQSFSLVRSLHDHPHRPKWTPGGGGLCLHTILPHPKEKRSMLVAMSTGGVYRTTDGAMSWHASNTGIRAEFLPDKHPEFGQCVHKVVRNTARPDRYFLQNHWGLYRSDDGGASWKDVANGVPSDFGFAMASHPHDPDTVYIVPIQSDEFRCTPGARLRVYRTRDGARSWQPLTRGLPQKDAWETVLRDALSTDTADPAGVYFGTRSGKLFASQNDGGSWECLADGLPPVTCVRAAVIGGGAKPAAPVRSRAGRKAASRARGSRSR